MTTAAVPSTDPVDFLLNVETFDAAINSTNLTLIDRLGATRSTLNGAINSLKAFNVRGAWVTATAYAIKDVYTSAGLAYVTVVAHTSTSIAADLAAGYVTVHQGATREDLAASSGSSLVGANTYQTQDAVNLERVSVKRFGAVGNGVADDTSAINDAIAYAALVNSGIFFPPGSYLTLGNHSLTGVKYAYADAGTVKILLSSSATSAFVFKPVKQRTKVSGIYFKSLGSSQTGITFESVFDVDISSCTFYGFSVHGIYAADLGNSSHGQWESTSQPPPPADEDGILMRHYEGARIINCNFYRCGHGAHLVNAGASALHPTNSAEYVSIVGCSFQDQCDWAIWSTSGNTYVTGCTITKTKNGIYIGNAGNGGHGTISSTAINHIFTDNNEVTWPHTYTPGVGLFFDMDNPHGHIIDGCSLADCSVYIGANTYSIRISSCWLALTAFNLDGARNVNLHDCTVYDAYGFSGITELNPSQMFASNIRFVNASSNYGQFLSGLRCLRGYRAEGTVAGATVASTGNVVVGLNGVCTASGGTTLLASNVFSANRITSFGFSDHITVDCQFQVSAPTGTDMNHILAYLLENNSGLKHYFSSLVVTSITDPNYIWLTLSKQLIIDRSDSFTFVLVNGTSATATIISAGSAWAAEGM